MSRLIDADDFWARLPRNAENITLADITEALGGTPTVNAEPVRHGRWVKVKRSGIEERLNKIYHISTVKCSCCNAQLDKTNIASVEALNYCPVCGAKMDLKDEVTK